MARPITWQDVVAPNQAGNLAAAAAASDQVSRSLTGLGGVATDIRSQIQQESTKAAVANILQSQDPAAAAAAVGDGFEFDPLAVANAANQRTTQLQQSRAADQSIRASESTVASQEAQRRDIEDRRLGAELAQPFLNLIQSGQYKGVPDGTFDGRGQGGIYAQEAIQRALQSQQEFSLRQRTANQQEREYLENKAAEDFLGFAREFGASAQGQLLDPAELDRRLTAEAKRRGVSPTLVDQATEFFNRGSAANTPTQAEFTSTAPGADGLTYQDAQGEISRRRSQIQAQRSAELAKPLNPDDEYSPSLLQLNEIATRSPAFQDGPLAFVASELAAKSRDQGGADMDQGEARKRIAKIQATFPHLTTAQAAEIALDTQDRRVVLGFNPGNSPEARAKAKLFQQLDKLGGVEGVQRKMKEATARFDAAEAQLPALERQLSGAARTGTDLPHGVQTIIGEFQKAEADAAARSAQEQADRAQAILDRANKAKKVQQEQAETFASGFFNY